MGKHRTPYAGGIRAQMVELVKSGVNARGA
jgi:hypothetical protein